MTKDELIKQIETEWDNLQAALDGLTEEQMHQPGVVGEWSIKDILAHIAACQTLLIATLFLGHTQRPSRATRYRYLAMK